MMPFETDPPVGAPESVLTDLAVVQPGVLLSKMDNATTKDDIEQSLHDFLDVCNVSRTTTTSSGLQQLTLTGRVGKLVDDRNQAVMDAAKKALTAIDPDAMIKAKNLLSESFKWLEAFQQTADLRQRIVMFMEGK